MPTVVVFGLRARGGAEQLVHQLSIACRHAQHSLWPQRARSCALRAPAAARALAASLAARSLAPRQPEPRRVGDRKKPPVCGLTSTSRFMDYMYYSVGTTVPLVAGTPGAPGHRRQSSTSECMTALSLPDTST